MTQVIALYAHSTNIIKITVISVNSCMYDLRVEIIWNAKCSNFILVMIIFLV
jgi:hypothetical protein